MAAVHFLHRGLCPLAYDLREKIFSPPKTRIGGILATALVSAMRQDLKELPISDARLSRRGGFDCAKPEPSKSVTELLVAWSNGEGDAMEALWPLIYGELRRLAAWRLRRERPDHTLQVTGLVHEAFLRLVHQEVAWESKAQFLAIASEIMRRVLIDYAKQRRAAKRGDGLIAASLEDSLEAPVNIDSNLILLDEALTRLGTVDGRAAKVIEMRFFGGFTNEEISAVLAISTATVQREWMWARAWLSNQIRSEAWP